MNVFSTIIVYGVQDDTYRNFIIHTPPFPRTNIPHDIRFRYDLWSKKF